MGQLRQPAFLRESFDDYHDKRTQYLTSHQLIDFNVCPLLYRKQLGGLVPEVSKACYLTGRAGHTLTLEGQAEFDKTYVVGGPINPKTDKPYGSDTQAYGKWAAEQTRVAIAPADYEICCAVSFAVRQHAEAAKLLSKGLAEGVLRAECNDVKCQVRLDWWNPDEGIVDLKTCRDLDSFESDATTYHYWEQLAFYQAIVTLAMNGERMPVHFIAAEKQEPYRVGVWLADQADLADAWHTNVLAIARLKECRRTNVWPTGYESKRILKRVA